MVYLLALFALTGSTLSAQAAAILTPSRDLLIDATTADLTRVTRVLVTQKGEIVANQMTDVRYFDATGKPFVFGRAGDGPGEFRNSLNIGMVGDTVWVADPMLRRTTFIGPNRAMLRTVRYATTIAKEGSTPPANLRFSSISPLAFFGDGSMLASVSMPAATGPQPDWSTSAHAGRTLFVHVSAEGAFKKIIAVAPPLGTCLRTFPTATGSINAPVPFCMDALRVVSVDGERIAFAQWDTSAISRPTYHLVVISAQGDTVVARDYPYSPVAIPAAAIDSAIKARLTAVQNRPEFVAAYANVPRLKTYPPLRAILVGRDRTIWLELFTVPGSRLWQVLDAKGNPVATVRVPGDITITTADLSNIWGLQTDNDGLQSVVRFKLSR